MGFWSQKKKNQMLSPQNGDTPPSSDATGLISGFDFLLLTSSEQAAQGLME